MSTDPSDPLTPAELPEPDTRRDGSGVGVEQLPDAIGPAWSPVSSAASAAEGADGDAESEEQA